MTHDDATLPGDLDTAHRQIRELAATLRQQTLPIAKLQHQLELLLRQRYGKKGERCDPDQLVLFGQDPPAEPMAPGTPPAEPAATIKPEGHGRKPLPAKLPRKRIVHDVAPEDRPCPGCGEERRPIGEDVREQLEYVPASFVVLQHVRPKYACKSRAAHVVIAERLPEPIEKGLPGTGLLAHVAVSKSLDHLPIYRSEGIFRRAGVDLSRSTMCDWMAVVADLLSPVVKEMTRRVLLSEVIQTDDTTSPVQDKTKDRTKKGRLWVDLGDRENRCTVYDHSPDHSGSWPEQFLKTYTSGYLQSDACTMYDKIHARGILEVACWAHARRKFHDARTTDPERSHAALAWIGRLYDAERLAKDQKLDDDPKRLLRLERSRPIPDSFGKWLDVEASN